MLKKLSFKIKKTLILAGIVAILVSILTGFAAIGAVIMLYLTGIIDILIGFTAVILGGIWTIGKLEKGSED